MLVGYVRVSAENLCERRTTIVCSSAQIVHRPILLGYSFGVFDLFLVQLHAELAI